jgi:hypothetical protein
MRMEKHECPKAGNSVVFFFVFSRWLVDLTNPLYPPGKLDIWQGVLDRVGTPSRRRSTPLPLRIVPQARDAHRVVIVLAILKGREPFRGWRTQA